MESSYMSIKSKSQTVNRKCESVVQMKSSSIQQHRIIIGGMTWYTMQADIIFWLLPSSIHFYWINLNCASMDFPTCNEAIQCIVQDEYWVAVRSLANVFLKITLLAEVSAIQLCCAIISGHFPLSFVIISLSCTFIKQGF